MNFKLIITIIVIIIFQSAASVCACTSFAVYSNQVYYGMNFDFIDLPVKFLITANGYIRTFHLAFERMMGDMKFFVNTAGMNNKGVFASCQELYPAIDNPPSKTDKNMFVFELYEAISSVRSAAEIQGICSERPIIDMPGITLHNLFADPGGRAFVTEAAGSRTAIIEKEKNFIAMTNFPNRSMIGKNYKTARGKGDTRFIQCHGYLEQHASDFNIEKGFKLLSMCLNKDPQYPTQCSLMFDPQKAEVYIAIKGDFGNILKLSIEHATIESFKGYENQVTIPLPAGSDGILLKDFEHRLHPAS